MGSVVYLHLKLDANSMIPEKFNIVILLLLLYKNT